jgi:putative YhdH/YhfP family quinone oxidoreductase
MFLSFCTILAKVLLYLNKGYFLMKAFVVQKNEDKFTSGIEEVEVPTLEEGEILIKSSYSSLNYKDALSSIGNPGVSRNFPHITGIDVSGVVSESKSDKFNVGDSVVITGYDFGMHTKGGHSEFTKVPDTWALHIPKGLNERKIMIYGTAGLTAALGVNELLNNAIVKGKVLVTGATGGVGSITVAILSKLGFEVVAITGKSEQIDFLQSIGASEVIMRSDFDVENKKPMLKGIYDGVVDTVGGNILAEALKQLKYDGVATCCGLTASINLHTNVFPFILRGVRLIGIDSVECSLEKKLAAWQKLGSDFKLDTLETLTKEISLGDLSEAYKNLLAGGAVGRYLVKI